MSKQPRANMSFQQAVLMAARAQTKNDIKAEVVEAATVLTNETKKSLISAKQRIDALEDIIKTKLGLTDQDLTEALWGVQERAFGLEIVDTPAADKNGIRFLVKEELEGKETDEAPAQESFLILGQDNSELPKELIEALTGSKAGDTRTVKLYSEQLKTNYTVTMKILRVYADKSKTAPKQ